MGIKLRTALQGQKGNHAVLLVQPIIHLDLQLVLQTIDVHVTPGP